MHSLDVYSQQAVTAVVTYYKVFYHRSLFLRTLAIFAKGLPTIPVVKVQMYAEDMKTYAACNNGKMVFSLVSLKLLALDSPSPSASVLHVLPLYNLEHSF